jgi:hypothetical protein
MTYLLAVAVVAGTPYAPAAYKAVERPILLARIQGHWHCAMMDPSLPNETRPFMQDLVICGGRYYYRGCYLLGQPGGRWTTNQIEGISPTSLRRYSVRYGGTPVKNDSRDTIRYVVREGGLEFNGAQYQRVPPGR